MKIVFIGTVDFSAKCLEHLIDIGAEVAGVCTLEESKINSDHYDLSSISKKHEIPCRYTKDINSEESMEWIRSFQPDIIFCFGWSQLIKKDLLELPPMGILGFHPAALPRNRGRHPLIWALALGLERTSSTFFFMDEGADSGDILSQIDVPIYFEDDAAALYNRVIETALKQIETFLPALKADSYKTTIQDQSHANIWRKRGKSDGEIDWRMPAEGIYNLVRSLNKPYVGAHFVYKDNEIKVWKCRIVKDLPSNAEPGKIISNGSYGFIIKTGTDGIELIDLESDFYPNVGDYL